jgi:hypothetical protein
MMMRRPIMERRCEEAEAGQVTGHPAARRRVWTFMAKLWDRLTPDIGVTA